ncbi:MAG: 50S ribosomal protein L7/L12 [Candidatus Cloacimonadota bacterium]|nr:MAG: 50S ribosomal protein L7/L12 [Candidatus Cloacimonadota bacterium]
MAEKAKKDQVIELVENMTVLELSELVKDLEEKFGVTAAAPVVATAESSAHTEEKKEEKTEFDVILKSWGAKKIQVIKIVRQITKLGLQEAKALVDKVPNTLKEAVPMEEAKKIKEQIEEVGGEVEIK